MQLLELPARGTAILIQGGLALLGVALAAKYAFKRFMAKKPRA